MSIQRFLVVALMVVGLFLLPACGGGGGGGGGGKAAGAGVETGGTTDPNDDGQVTIQPVGDPIPIDLSGPGDSGNPGDGGFSTDPGNDGFPPLGGYFEELAFSGGANPEPATALLTILAAGGLASAALRRPRRHGR